MTCHTNFETVYSSYFSKIHNYLIRMVGSYHAQDLTQEVFDRVHKNLNSLKDEKSLATWIYRIATNAAIDKTRTLSYREGHDNGLEDQPHTIHDQDVWTGRKKTAIDQKLIKEEMRSCVQEFIGRLPEAYRTVLILKDFEERPNREVAQIMDITVSTVKIRYHRAKRMLKKELDAGCVFFYDDENRILCDRKQIFHTLEKQSEHDISITPEPKSKN